MYYPDELVEEVRSRSDVVDVIGNYVRLTKRGSTYFGLCPFHNEKTPSFSVTPSKQMYYCFGCGKGGNVFTFLMDYENITFSEAMKSLADRAGVSLPEREDPEAKKEASLRQTLLDINKEAGRYFYYQLKSPNGRHAYEYLRGRGLTDETIKHFGLGYSNPYSDDLYRYFKSKGYSDTILKETGLFSLSGKGAYDKFWNRVMFPIMDANSRIIGFGGRVMGEGEPKYLNSPETKLFDKSRNLYGLNYARQARKDFMIICEGYMDVIAMHQAGFTNAVASLGTALTSPQASLLKRYTSQLVLAYDSDGAGVKAAMRAIPLLRHAGHSIKVLNMRPYKDPDEFMKALGAEEFTKRIENAENYFLYQIAQTGKDFDLSDPEQKTRFSHEVAKRLAGIEDEMARSYYLDVICDRHMLPKDLMKKQVAYYGNQVGIMAKGDDRQDTREDAFEERTNVRNDAQKGLSRKDKENGIRKVERILLTWLSAEPRLFPKVAEILSPEDFEEGVYRQVAEKVWEGLKKGSVEPASIINAFVEDEEMLQEAVQIFNTPLPESLSREEREKAFSESIIRIRSNSLNQKGRTATDMKALQEIIREQNRLATLKIRLED